MTNEEHTEYTLSLKESVNVDTREAERPAPGPAQGPVDAAPSAEGDLRGLPRAVGRIDGVSLSRIWHVSGRIPGDDEDTTAFVEAEDRQEAYDRFEEAIYEGEAEDLMDLNIQDHGSSLFVNALERLADIILLRKPS